MNNKYLQDLEFLNKKKEAEAKEKENLISKIQEINKKKRHGEWLIKYKWSGRDHGKVISERERRRFKHHPQPQPNLEKQWNSAEYKQLKKMSLQGVKQVWEQLPKLPKSHRKPRWPSRLKPHIRYRRPTKEEMRKKIKDAFKILNKIIPRDDSAVISDDDSVASNDSMEKENVKDDVFKID